MSHLHVVALISGGKDSLFSLLHCFDHGHKLVALANLYPPPPDPLSDPGTAVSDPLSAVPTNPVEGGDLNSFMYQTVGHSVISLYAEALGLPLYRQPIHGKAVDQNRDYSYVPQPSGSSNAGISPSSTDETEDLTVLLQRIKLQHPETNAISTGAILSTYQRTRVESVAARLNLTCLSYLWQYPFLPPPVERQDSVTGLLDDMEAAGCDARLIKIASAGIPDNMLFERVSRPLIRQRLVSGQRRFVEAGNVDSLELRASVLGEGGEYETLSLDGPRRLWQKRILVDETANRVVRDEGDVTRVEVGAATVESHDESLKSMEDTVRFPQLVDYRFMKIRENSTEWEEDHINISAYSRNDTQIWQLPQLSESLLESNSTTSLHNLTDSDLSRTVDQQTVSILKRLDERLQNCRGRQALPAPRIVFTLVLLRDMADFAVFNAVYGRYFNQTNPPSRVTVCCGDTLPKGTLLSMSAHAVKMHSGPVDGLHVQSISYWAPANIGPYSQAISYPIRKSDEAVERLVHVAGQIPLVPSTMEILNSTFLDQAILSLQHLWRVGQCVQVDWWAHGTAYLGDADEETIAHRARVAWKIWEEAHRRPSSVSDDVQDSANEEDDGFDVWNSRFNHQSSSEPRLSRALEQSHLRTLPDHSVLGHAYQSDAQADIIPPFLAAQVSSLPRAASVEWHSLGLACLPKPPQQPGRLETRKERSPWSGIACSWLSDATISDSVQLQVFSIQICSPRALAGANAGHQISRDLSLAITRFGYLRPGLLPQPSPQLASLKDAQLTIYVCSQYGYDALHFNKLLPVDKAARTDMGVTIIPCQSLWGEDGEKLELAILGRR